MPTILLLRDERQTVTAVVIRPQIEVADYIPAYPTSPGFAPSGVPVGTGLYLNNLNNHATVLHTINDAIFAVKGSDKLTDQQKAEALTAIAGLRPGDAILNGKEEPGVKGVIDRGVVSGAASTLFRLGMAITKFEDP